MLKPRQKIQANGVCLHFLDEPLRIRQWHDWHTFDHDLDETSLQSKFPQSSVHIPNTHKNQPHTLTIQQKKQPNPNGKWLCVRGMEVNSRLTNQPAPGSRYCHASSLYFARNRLIGQFRWKATRQAGCPGRLANPPLLRAVPLICPSKDRLWVIYIYIIYYI